MEKENGKKILVQKAAVVKGYKILPWYWKMVV